MVSTTKMSRSISFFHDFSEIVVRVQNGYEEHKQMPKWVAQNYLCRGDLTDAKR